MQGLDFGEIDVLKQVSDKTHNYVPLVRAGHVEFILMQLISHPAMFGVSIAGFVMVDVLYHFPSVHPNSQMLTLSDQISTF